MSAQMGQHVISDLGDDNRSCLGCLIAESLFFLLHFTIQKSKVCGINGKLGYCGGTAHTGISLAVILTEDHWTRSGRILTTTCCKS